MATPPRRFADGCVLTLSSVFGLGYLPWAPGSWGSLGGVFCWQLLAPLPTTHFAAVVVLLSLSAICVAQQAERIYQGHDVQHIVLDEVVGLLITAIGVPYRLPQIVAVFVLFRLLDTLKPYPIGWVDRHVGGGLGVVLDDVLAGLLGNAVLQGICWWRGGWW